MWPLDEVQGINSVEHGERAPSIKCINFKRDAHRVTCVGHNMVCKVET